MAGRRAAAALAGLTTLVVAAGCGSGSAPASHRRTTPATTLRLGVPGRALPAGFLGLSLEFQAVRAYTGTDPHAVNPVFAALVRGLSPGQRPVLRIGGDSTDVSWAPAPGVTPPRFAGYRYPLTPGWFATTAALAHELDARMILGLNIAAGDPALTAAEARVAAHAFGRGSIDAFELGNEPNLYGSIRLWKLADGRPVTARPRHYGPVGYRRDITAAIAALPAADPPWAFAGPALAASQEPDPTGRWSPEAIAGLLHGEPAMRLLTLHRYPLKNCYTSPPSPQYPTIAHLLSEYATSGLAAGVRRWVSLARAQGRTVRVDELNSAACRGKPGVSNTFASALWASDALFSLADVGVGGVNIHTLPDAAYRLFTFAHAHGHWVAHVEPEYYGLELFAQAAPVGARLVAVSGAPHTRSLSAWATRAPGGTERLVLIDKDPGHPRVLRIPVPDGTRGPVRIERLRAASVAATGGVSLGGRSFGARTETGRLPAPQTTVAPRADDGDVVVRLPGASAALVTFSR
jgi:hypothetical protein